jgi:hypothetical protein
MLCADGIAGFLVLFGESGKDEIGALVLTQVHGLILQSLAFDTYRRIGAFATPNVTVAEDGSEPDEGDSVSARDGNEPAESGSAPCIDMPSTRRIRIV